MTLEIRGRKFLVIDMFVVTKNPDAILRYNVFDENYKHLTTIDVDDYDDFLEILNARITLNKF